MYKHLGCEASLWLRVVSVLVLLAVRVTSCCVRWKKSLNCSIILRPSSHQPEDNRMTGNRGKTLVTLSCFNSWLHTWKHFWYFIYTQIYSQFHLYSLWPHNVLMRAASRKHLAAFRQTHSKMWRDKTIKSFSSFSNLGVECSVGSAWFGLTASRTCVANRWAC